MLMRPDLLDIKGKDMALYQMKCSKKWDLNFNWVPF